MHQSRLVLLTKRIDRNIVHQLHLTLMKRQKRGHMASIDSLVVTLKRVFVHVELLANFIMIQQKVGMNMEFHD